MTQQLLSFSISKEEKKKVSKTLSDCVSFKTFDNEHRAVWLCRKRHHD